MKFLNNLRIDLFSEGFMKIMLTVLIIVLLLLGIFHFYNIIAYSPLNIDGGYYLSVARIFAEGGELFKDINMPYSPMGIWIYSLFYPIFQENYQGYMIITEITLMICCYVAYLISRRLNVSILFSFFTGIYTYIFTSSYGGSSIVLEPFCLLFGLICVFLALYAENRKPTYYLLAGILTFFSYWSKQYGLYVLPGMIYLIYFSEHSLKRKNLLFFNYLFGFTACLFITAIYFYLRDNNIDSLLKIMIGKNSSLIYDLDKITGVNYSIKIFTGSVIRYIVKIIPFLPIVIYGIIKYRKYCNKTYINFLLLIISFSSMTLVFASYSHYFILITPYIIILSFYVIEIMLKNISNQRITMTVLVICFLLSCGFLTRRITTFKNYHQSRKKRQDNLSSRLLSYVPQNSKVFLTEYAIWFLNKYYPLNNDIGYAFIMNFNDERIQRMIPTDGYYIHKNGDLNISKYEDDYTKYIIQDNNFFKDDIIVLKKK